MPIKEISAESVRDKSIRHGHISTLHLWWARRPLPVCRAVIFASLVPDPLDPECPQAFCDAVQDLLANNPLYAPYPDIPYTSIYDPMPDNLRNRLLMFIGKFSPVCQKNMLAGKTTPSKELHNKSDPVPVHPSRKPWPRHLYNPAARNSHLPEDIPFRKSGLPTDGFLLCGRYIRAVRKELLSSVP